jgi:hypothetical protein
MKSYDEMFPPEFQAALLEAYLEGGQEAYFELRANRIREVGENQTWFVRLPDNIEAADINFDTPGLNELEWFEDYFHEWQLMQREIALVTTKDMTAMPLTQPIHGNLMQLERGRWLNHDDYINQRPVAMVHRQFGAIRGLMIGSIITVAVPQTQNPAEVRNMGLPAGWDGADDGSVNPYSGYDFLKHDFSSDWDGPMEHIELEIVGTYSYHLPRRFWQDTFPFRTELNTSVFVPASLGLPQAAATYCL